jgi:hypothetical protein
MSRQQCQLVALTDWPGGSTDIRKITVSMRLHALALAALSRQLDNCRRRNWASSTRSMTRQVVRLPGVPFE